jgi:hypothetical protein
VLSISAPAKHTCRDSKRRRRNRRSSIRKGRNTQTRTNRDIPTRVGNFVYVTRLPRLRRSTTSRNTATWTCIARTSRASTRRPARRISARRLEPPACACWRRSASPPTPRSTRTTTVYKLFFYDVAVRLPHREYHGHARRTSLAITLHGRSWATAHRQSTELSRVRPSSSTATSPISGTFTVNNYSTNTTFAFVTFKEFLPTLPNANTTYKSSVPAARRRFVRVVRRIRHDLLTAPLKAKFAFQADVDPSGKVTGLPVGNTFMSDSDNNGLLYQIPEKFPKANTMTTNTAIFTSWVANDVECADVLIDQHELHDHRLRHGLHASRRQRCRPRRHSGSRVLRPDGRRQRTRKASCSSRDTPGTRRVRQQRRLLRGSATTTSRSPTSTQTTATTRSSSASRAPRSSDSTPRQKTLIIGNTTPPVGHDQFALNGGQIEFHTLNATANFAYSLKTADVFNIRKVLYKSQHRVREHGHEHGDGRHEPLHARHGQRDNTYEYSRLVACRQRASAWCVRPDALLVIFDWFQHTGRGYATVDSYLSSHEHRERDDVRQIPSYTSTKLGNTLVNSPRRARLPSRSQQLRLHVAGHSSSLRPTRPRTRRI